MRRLLVFCDKLINKCSLMCLCSKRSSQCSSTDKWNLKLCRLILESIDFILFSRFLTLDIDKFDRYIFTFDVQISFSKSTFDISSFWP